MKIKAKNPGKHLSRIAYRVSPFLSRIAYRVSPFLLFVILLSSCDLLPEPFIREPEPNDSITVVNRNVLVLEFTGHTCKWCPRAHRMISQMQDLYDDQLITVSFHLGHFARPESGPAFSSDYRTPEGNILEEYFPFISFPTGTVNRLDKEALSPYTSWPAEAAQIVKSESPLLLEAEAQYLPALGGARLTVTGTPLANLEGHYKLAAWVTEDHITDWQKDIDADPQDVREYQHNHLFRKSAGGVWGESVGEDKEILKKGTIFVKEFSLALDPAWRPEHCNWVYFVYRTGTLEVIQAGTLTMTTR